MSTTPLGEALRRVEAKLSTVRYNCQPRSVFDDLITVNMTDLVQVFVQIHKEIEAVEGPRPGHAEQPLTRESWDNACAGLGTKG